MAAVSKIVIISRAYPQLTVDGNDDFIKSLSLKNRTKGEGMFCKIREALPEDVQAMADIAVEAFWKEYGSRERAEKAFKETVAKRWRFMIERKTGTVLVAEKDGQVVGFLVFRWWFGWNGWLEVIAVKEKYRDRGIGTRLMKTLIRKVRERGYAKICLAIKQDEALTNFYKKFDARNFGKLPDEESGILTLYYIPVLACQA